MQLARVGPALVAVVAAAVLAACPKKPPEPVVEPTEPQPPAPVLVRDFAALTPGFYPELQQPEVEPEDVSPVLLADLSRARDVDEWTTQRSVWGTLPVIEFVDTDRRTTAVGAAAAWFLTTAADGSELVDAALVRDFTGAPVADDPQALLAVLGEAWPPPWTLCERGDGDGVVTFDAERRTKLLFVPVSAGWTVDHVEYWSPTVEPEAWWIAKGYDGCVEQGTLLENGRFRPPRKSS